jgi:hypothetical protein
MARQPVVTKRVRQHPRDRGDLSRVKMTSLSLPAADSGQALHQAPTPTPSVLTPRRVVAIMFLRLLSKQPTDENRANVGRAFCELAVPSWPGHHLKAGEPPPEPALSACLARLDLTTEEVRYWLDFVYRAADAGRACHLLDSWLRRHQRPAPSRQPSLNVELTMCCGEDGVHREPIQEPSARNPRTQPDEAAYE